MRQKLILNNRGVLKNGLKSTYAVQNANVHVITWDIFSGLPLIVGELYFAKWIQPELFKDIDPEEVYAKLLKKFFDIEEFTPRIYPN